MSFAYLSEESFRPALNGSTAGGINETARHWKQWNSPEEMAVAFGENQKAQMTARVMFDLVHKYGDTLREGWMNVLDCLLYMLKANLLPASLVQLEDFVELSGFVSLKQRFKRRPTVAKKEESGLLSWLGLTGGPDTGGGEPGQSRPRRDEEKELNKLATNVMAECHPEQIVLDSRYLAGSSLTELVNSIIHCSFTVAAPILCTLLNGTAHQQQQENQLQQHQQHSQQMSTNLSNFVKQRAPHFPLSASSAGDGHVVPHQSHDLHQNNGPTVVKLSMEEEEAMIFLLELLTNIVVENRDRLVQVWSPVRDYLRTLFSHFPLNQQLMERAVVSIIRIVNRQKQQSHQTIAGPNKTNQKNGQDCACNNADEVLHFMGCELLALRPPELFLFSRQIAFGIHQLLRANAAMMQPADWENCFAEVLFPLLRKFLDNNPPISPMDPIAMEEARIRAIQFTCKILLGNLTQIIRLDTFGDLLSYLFDLMDQFMERNSCSDLLAEVIQESLKNCALVCENFGVFRDNLAKLHGQLQHRLILLAKKNGKAPSPLLVQ